MPEVLKPGTKRKSAVKAAAPTSINPIWREQQKTKLRGQVEKFLKFAEAEEFTVLRVMLEAWERLHAEKRPANVAGLFAVPSPSANHSQEIQ